MRTRMRSPISGGRSGRGLLLSSTPHGTSSTMGPSRLRRTCGTTLPEAGDRFRAFALPAARCRGGC